MSYDKHLWIKRHTMTSSTQAIRAAPSAPEIEIFCRANFEEGPHAIPKTREVRNEIHRFYSIKAGNREIVCESPLEADVLIYHEGIPRVVSLCEQALRIYGAIRNRPYYTFDLRIEFNDQSSVYYEVKPSNRLCLYDNGRRCPCGWMHIESWCQTHGKKCDFITELDMAPYRQFIANWRTLLPFARKAYESPDPDLERSIIGHIHRSGPITFSEVQSYEASSVTENVINYVAKLLHQGRIAADLNSSPVSPLIALSVSAEDQADA